MSNDFELPSKQKRGSSNAPIPSLPKQDVEDLPETPDEIESKKENVDPNAEPEYSQEELLQVFDEIIFSGEYQETFNIRGKVPVTFRTRTAEEISEIQRYIDSAGSQLISTVENIRSIMNLKYSLCNYRGNDLTMLKSAEKTKFIEKLPAPIVGMLLVMLAKFDNKVAQACREGKENF